VSSKIYIKASFGFVGLITGLIMSEPSHANERSGTTTLTTTTEQFSLTSTSGKGLLVTAAAPDAAWQLNIGDIVASLDDRQLQTPEDFYSAIRSAKVSALPVTIIRQGKTVTFPLELDIYRRHLPPEPPSPPGRAGSTPPTPPTPPAP
jgi:S1-C subfamily serine protease